MELLEMAEAIMEQIESLLKDDSINKDTRFNAEEAYDAVEHIYNLPEHDELDMHHIKHAYGVYVLGKRDPYAEISRMMDSVSYHL